MGCHLHILSYVSVLSQLTSATQKTHSASILNAPKAYEAQEKRNSQKIIEMDCRGLEFIEFKPDVSDLRQKLRFHVLTFQLRAIGRPRLSILPLPSPALTSSKASGTTMTRRRERRLVLRS
jgi:hypothetical protein